MIRFQKKTIFCCCGLQYAFIFFLFANSFANGTDAPPELMGAKKKTVVIDSLKPSSEFDRHDPSNIIFFQDKYWVYYTRNVDNHRDVSIHTANSIYGYEWKDIGLAIRRGTPGSWDESGTIAPYIVPHDGCFYLFYTGFRNGDLNTRDLGCAIADSPQGPWKRYEHNPILRRSQDLSAWDSGMLGDSNVVFRDGRWWLFFKSRRSTETSNETRIGVAIADRITGPYQKHPKNPLFAGHAFSAWIHRDGVAAICGVISPVIKWSQDGIHFIDAGEMQNTSTGFFCPENFVDGTNNRGVSWGLERYTVKGHRGLHRFDCTMTINDALVR